MSKRLWKFLLGIILSPESSDPSTTAEGSLWVNSVSKKLKAYLDSGVRSVVTEDQAQALSNKTIDADQNTITNIENADIKAAAGIQESKLTLDYPTSTLNTNINNHISDSSDAHDASAISYVNTTSGLTATDAQAAIDEVEGRLDTAESDINGIQAKTDFITITQAVDLDAVESASHSHTNKTILDNTTASFLTAQETKLGHISVTQAVDLDTMESNIGTNTTNIGTNTTKIGNLETLSGVASGSTHLGTFTGTTIPDNSTNKAALQALETSVEGKISSTDLTNHMSDTTTHGTTGDIVGTSDSQTLTNKKFDDALLVKELATPSTPAAGYQKIYPKADGYLYKIDDNGLETKVGSGSGGSIDFLIEKKIADFSTYDDGAVDTPVDGTLGSPSIVTVSEETSSKIDSTPGILNLKISKASGDGKGEGVSVAFSTRGGIDRAKPQVVQLEVKSSASYLDSNFGVWIYDVTNSRLISTVQRDISASSLVSSQIFEFQTSPDSDSYRLIFHCRDSVNTAAYDLTCVVKVGPAQVVKGPVTTNWTSCTVSGTMTSNTTYTGMERRVGDSTDYRIHISFSGVPNSTTLDITLPRSIDTTKFINAATSNYNLGKGSFTDASTGISYPLKLRYISSNTIRVYPDKSDSTFTYNNDSFTQAVPVNTIDSGDSINIEMKSIPVLGWGSSQVLSSDAGGRLITASYYKSSSQTITAGSLQQVTFENARISSSFFTASTFTSPESGDFSTTLGLLLIMGATPPSQVNVEIRVNGTQIAHWEQSDLVANKEYMVSIDQILRLNKGDLVTVYASSSGQNITVYIGNFSRFNIFKISSPQQIAASEKVYASYSTDAGQSIADTTQVDLIFEDRQVDSHNAYNTTTGVYTCPRSGSLDFSSSILLTDSTAWTQYDSLVVKFIHNGASTYLVYFKASATTGSNWQPPTIPLNLTGYPVSKGDTLKLAIQQFSGSTTALINAGTYNRFMLTIS